MDSPTEEEAGSAVEETKGESQSSLDQADLVYSQGDLRQAIPLYEKALEELQASHDDVEPILQSTMGNLAQCYIGMQRVPEAIILYRRCLLALEKTVGPEHRDTLSIIVQMGQCLERIGQSAQAEAHYGSALRLATSTLVPGDALFILILESYAGLLARDGRHVPQVAALQEQAKLSRDEYVDSTLLNERIIGVLKQTMPADFARDPNDITGLLNRAPDRPQRNTRSHTKLRGINTEEQSVLEFHKEQKPSALASSLEGFWTRHPWIIPASILILPIVAGLIWFNQSQSNERHDEVVLQTAKNSFHPSTYISADGFKKVTMLSPNQLEITIGPDTKTAEYAFLTPGQDPPQPANTPNTRLNFKLNGYCLSDQDGTVLYRSDAPELQVADRMKAVAEAARKAYLLAGEYPQDNGLLNAAGPSLSLVNPISGVEDTSQITYLGRADGTGSFAGLEAMIDQGTVVENEPTPESGAVHAYYLLANDGGTGMKSRCFLIRGCDSGGMFLTSSAHGRCYDIILEHGDNTTHQHILDEYTKGKHVTLADPVFVTIHKH